MRAGPCFEDAHNGTPESTAQDAHDDDHQQVQAERQVPGKPHVGSERGADDDLALGADVEQAGTEGQRNTQPGANKGCSHGHGFQQRCQSLAGVEDRALEKRNIALGHGCP